MPDWVARFRADERGTATIEFVIIAPVLFALVFSIFESGWLLTKSIMLDRGLDMAVRSLRLGIPAAPTHDGIKQMVCDNAGVFRDCETLLKLEMVRVANSEDISAPSFPSLGADCIDRASEVAPVFSFNPGVRAEIMFVRACVIVDPIFPGIGLGLALPKDSTGGFSMVSYSAFANEPD